MKQAPTQCHCFAAFMAAAALALFAAPSVAQAQQDDLASRTPLEMGAFVQFVAQATSGTADVFSDGDDGFVLERVRLSAEGEPASGIAYEVEADFAEGFELRDARIDVELAPGARLRVGQFKAPFSHSYLGSSSRMPFVRRPRVVGALRLGRRIGAEVRFRLYERLTLRGGLFNATPPGEIDDLRAKEAREADEHYLLYVGRASWSERLAGGSLTLGANAAYDASRDAAPRGDRGARSELDGLRYGADVHAEWERAFVTAEVLARGGRARAGAVASGAYLSAGYRLDQRHQVRVRLDYLAGGDASTIAGSAPTSYQAAPTVLGFGYTFDLRGPLRLEVDYLTPFSKPGFSQSGLLANLQLRV